MRPPPRANRRAPASTAPGPEAAPAPTRRTTRGRPRKSHAEPEPEHEEAPDMGMATRTRSARPSSSAPVRTSSLTEDPIARKGAPRSKAGSEVSIPFSPARNEDDDEEYDEEPHDGDEEHEEEEEDADAAATYEEEEQGEAEQVDQGAESLAETQMVQADTHSVLPRVQVSDDFIQFVRHNVVRLTSIAERILSEYRPFADTEGFLRKTYEMDLQMLAPVREAFALQKGIEPFVDWTWLQDCDDLERIEVHGIKSAFVITNLATLMAVVYSGAASNLGEAGKQDLRTLTILDDNFAALLLCSSPEPVATTETVNLALAVRRARLIAALADPDVKNNGDAARTAYDIFCKAVADPDEESIQRALTEGPYLDVLGLASAEVQDRCRRCLSSVLRNVNAASRATFTGIGSLRRRHPASEILDAVKFLYKGLAQHFHDLRGAWQMLQNPAEAGEEPGEEEPVGERPVESGEAADEAAEEEVYDTAPQGNYGDEDDSDDSDDSDDESQHVPITRMSDTQAGPSMYAGISSIRALVRSKPAPAPAPAPAPPSNQQATTPTSSRQAATANRQTTTPSRQATGNPSGRSTARAAAARASPSPAHARRRKRAADDLDADYDDEDDDFETDTRRLSSQAREAKRQRILAQEAARVQQRLNERQRQQQIQLSSPPHPRTSQSRPPPPLSTSTTAVGTQPPPSFAAKPATPRRSLTETRIITTAVSPAAVTRHRLDVPAPAGARHRTPWSEGDSRVLIRCIARRYGKWSLIEKQDKHLFEHPRNQQAYRDRARNMKVDFLIADARLPAGFDFVMLGIKERARVCEYGKNPLRKETDVDLHTGQVLNTVWTPGMPE